MEATQTYLKEIFATAHGAVYQCDKEGNFLLEFAGQTSSFKFPCFFSLRKRINQIDLAKMLSNPDTSSDIEIVCPCGSNRVFILSPMEVILFKELLNGAKVMMELNSILFERLYRVTV
ncbi:hypothetical protein [Sporocytophaga myxococcoides]|uniref:hypothetical protein n=1 Tax=Sporocytophaga myxococcoides TaxID=153721 RepID=UPI000401389C|nr:hypothetical protein [Sporocytophaga myxococcoides]